MNSVSRFVLRSVFIMSAALFLYPAALRGQAATDKPGDQATAEASLQYVRVDGVAKDQFAIDVTAGPPETPKQLHLVIKDTVVKDRLGQLHKGDRITIVYSMSANQNVLRVFKVDTASGGP